MNCSYAEAEKAIAKMDQGDAIFRPSSKVRKDIDVDYTVHVLWFIEFIVNCCRVLIVSH